ncbi:MAG TPA: hypothetical protein VKW70_06260 [Terriglobia bacterium]|nr:hypothetical protein [Terriglobia bacterium]
MPIKLIRRMALCALIFLAAVSLAFGQESQTDAPPSEPSPQQNAAPAPGWHRFSNPPAQQGSAPPNSNAGSSPANSQNLSSGPNQSTDPPAGQESRMIPERLTIRPGTFITIRIDQYLSSDKNQAGDGFSGTLVQPIVVDGIVVAQRGETVGGRVAEAQKAGRIKGVSRLALELNELTLVDGQQVTIMTQLASGKGPTSVGRDATAIGGTSAAGAAIGAAAEGGAGAAIGAGAGAVAATVGVLLTRGRPTVIYPETVLTFQTAAAVTVFTDRAPQAFRYVQPTDYQQPANSAPPRLTPANGCAGYGCPPPPPPYYWPPYPPYFYPYFGPAFYPFYGPSFTFFYAPRFYGGFHGGFHGGGFGHRR